MKHLSNERGVLPIIVAILVVVLVVVAGFAAYNLDKSHNNTQATKGSTTISSSPSLLINSTGHDSSTASPNPSLATLKVPELGIELTHIPQSLNHMQYSIRGDNIAYFGTASLTDLDGNCSQANFDYGGIGQLSAVSGKYDGYPLDSAAFVKQFNGFWVEYAQPRSQCSVTGGIAEALRASQIVAFEAFVKTSSNLLQLTN